MPTELRWTAVITNAGTELEAKTPSKTFSFTKAQCGSGTVPISELANQTAISGFQKNLSITSISNKDNIIKLRLQLSNSGVTAGFDLYQIGVYAKVDTDATDVLYMIIQASTPDRIPSATESPNYVNDYLTNTAVLNASSIVATIDSAAYVTHGEIADVIEQVNSVVDTANEAKEIAEEALAAARIADNKAVEAKQSADAAVLLSNAANSNAADAKNIAQMASDNASIAITAAQEANSKVGTTSDTVSGLTADVTILAFQLAVQNLANSQGMKHILTEIFDAASDVALISGQYANGKFYI